MFNSTQIASDAGVKKALNMAMLGAASAFLPIEANVLEGAIAGQFGDKKPGLAEKNINVFRAARQTAQESS